jgi:hypothetical protein
MPVRRAGRALWAVTAPRADAAAQSAVAHRRLRWEEVAGTSKRGPRSMRLARRGVMGLTEVAQHRRGGGERPARRRFDGGGQLSRAGQSGVDPAGR